MYGEDNVDFQANQMITQFKSLDKLEEQLKYIITLLYSLDTKSQDHFSEEIRKFENIFIKNKYMREVRHRDALVNEYPSEYFGKDFGSDDPFNYKEKLEIDMTKLTLELMMVLGRIIKRMKEQHLVIGDDT